VGLLTDAMLIPGIERLTRLLAQSLSDLEAEVLGPG